MISMKKRGLCLGLSALLIMAPLTPGTVLAAETTPPVTEPIVEIEELGYLIFQTSNDQQVIIGSSGTISFRLYNEDGDPYTGSASGYISDPEGTITYISVSGGQGSFSISNYTFDQLGEYDIVLWDKYDNYASGTLEVVEPVVTVTGSLVVNSKNTVKVKITDPDGNVLSRKSITVDADAVGANSSTYTTLFDGTLTFTLSPTKLGTVNLVYGGHVIGSIEVTPAYTSGSRIGGQASDNASLSVDIAQSGWSSATHVILTRDDAVADAMVAVPLSKAYDAPILMTDSTTLDEEVLDEILNLGAETVFIIGGTGAISAGTEQVLENYGLETYRFAGKNRYDTAAQIAGWVGSGDTDTVYLAYGYGEADALAVSAFAADQGIPILLTDTNSIPSETQSRLKQLSPSKVVIIGGTGIISPGVEKQLNTQYAVKRWGGVDRYGTQQIILQNLVKKESPVYITSGLVSPQDGINGQPYGNALLASALAAKNDGFVVIVPRNNLPSAVNYSLTYNKGFISSATVVGTTGAVSISLEQQIHELLKH